MRRPIATILTLVPLVLPWPAAATTVTGSLNGHSYEAVSSAGLGWAAAKLAARQRGCGWNLAAPTTKAEDQFVFGLVKGKAEFFVGTDGPWLGGYQKSSRVEPAGNWAWVTGETFTFKHWAPSEPDNKTKGDANFEPGIKAGQSEEVIHYLATGAWDDANVTAQAHGYILELDPARQAACK
jgi:hypothetical protein